MKITIYVTFNKRNPKVEQQVMNFLRDEFGAKMVKQTNLLEPGGRRFELGLDPNEFFKRWKTLKGAKADGN